MDKKLNVTHQLICWAMFIHTWLWKNVPCPAPPRLKKWLGIPWWSSGYRILLPLEGTQVQSLVGELGSHKPCGQKKKDWKQFLKKAFGAYDSFYENFFGCTTGHVWSRCSPLPNLRDQVPYSRSPGKLSPCMQLFFDLSLLIIRFLVFLGMQVSPCSRVKHKQTHKPVCDIVFL